jgi:sarcosine oxidase
METVDVAVIGGGVMGAATAWRLGRRGIETLLLERFALGHDRGSSHGPSRVFRFVYGDPFYVRLAQQALPLWRELETESGRELLELTGGLDIGPWPALEPVSAALESCGAECERLELPSSRYPALRYRGTALFSPDTGVVAAAASVSAMIELARKSGVEVLDQTKAGIEALEEAQVTIGYGDQRVRARRCVLATGAWMNSILKRIDIRIPFTVTRENIAYFPTNDDFPVIVDRGTAPSFLFAMPRRFGSPGARFGHHKTGRVVNPDESATKSDPEFVKRVSAFASEILEPGAEPSALETCLYTTTPDDDFVIDHIGALCVASPCSGHGFKFAPLVGEMLARLALDEEPIVDLARFRLSRF